MWRSLMIGIVLLTGLYSSAQSGHFVFTNYTTTQGLPDNTIQSLLTDSRGFLWIGTNEGLSRFDGKNFKNFFAARKDSLLQTNFFSALYEYKKGHLVMSNGGCPIGFNTITETFYTLPISHLCNVSLSKASIGSGWLLNAFNKLYLLNQNLQITDSVNLPQADASLYVSGLYLQPNELLIQAKDSCWRYHIPSRTMSPLPIFFNFPDNRYYPYLRYYDEQRQELWFCEYEQGLYRHSLRTGRTDRMQKAGNGEPFITHFAYRIFPVTDSTLWFLTESGIRIWNRNSNTITAIKTEKGNPTSLAGDAVFASCTDNEGNYWFGTNDGISKLNANSLRITAYNEGFGNNGLMSVVKGADNNMYASVYNGATSTINIATQQVTEWLHKLNSGSWNLFVRGDEVIRTGFGKQLLAYNTRSKKYYPLNFLLPWYPDIELVVMGFLHSNGDEWYCANRNGGFVRKLAGTNTYKTYRKGDGVQPFSNGYYTSHAEDKKGDLWFGVNKGNKLLHWSMSDDRFTEIDLEQIKETGKQLAGINSVACDALGNVWVAYNGSGLICYNPSQRTGLHYTIANGLPSDFITGLQFDGQQRLWATTMKGLSCFIEQENRFVTFRREDGLPADNFTDYCTFYDSTTNQLWLGAQSVLMHFNPDELLLTGHKQFPVYIDELYLNGKRYRGDINNVLSLKASENNLQFHFVGVDLNKGKDIEYSYQLQGKGVDTTWNLTGTNQTASYANLKPGDYTFIVRARYKGDNGWKQKTIPLRFTIATPWQQSWWFLLLVALAAGLLIWHFIRTYYVSRLEKEKARLEKQKAIEQERTRIATDMHDDFGASLSRIKFLSEKIKLKEQKDTNLQQELNKISGYSDEMAEKMGEIVWALNQKYDTLGDLVAFCRAYASEYLEMHHIHLLFEEAVSERPLKGEVRRNLFLVLKECLHNTVKHAGASKVQIGMLEKENQLHITVRDNGAGMPTNIRPFANGLENMKKRVHDCAGEIRFYNDAGMVVDIHIPLPGNTL